MLLVATSLHIHVICGKHVEGHPEARLRPYALFIST